MASIGCLLVAKTHVREASGYYPNSFSAHSGDLPENRRTQRKPQIKVPVRPLLLEGTEPPGTVLQTLWHDYPDRLLKIYRYDDLDGLLVSLKEKVIDPAEAKAKDLKLREFEDIFE